MTAIDWLFLALMVVLVVALAAGIWGGPRWDDQ